VLERLEKNVTNRPKKKETLLRHLKSISGKDATEADAAQIFERLRSAGYLEISDKGAITYRGSLRSDGGDARTRMTPTTETAR
jgi:hypothetical protein